MTAATRDLVKVTFSLEGDAWHGCASERLWSTKVGDNRYRLQNSPFYAKGVSRADVVFAQLKEDGSLVFTGVSLRGGHSTYRVLLLVPVDGEMFRNHWAPIEALGCGFEGVTGKLLSIDVPPVADIYVVYALLQAGENAGVWEFEEGHCGHPLREKGATRETR